ncbi:MAG: hypothetical protein HY901_04020 [Deltaproteobacteria bacterium]|nr:hypothetical protein [Deltaproteobacteria bacterium]
MASSGGTFAMSSYGMNMVYTCPDQSKYETFNALGLLGCGGADGGMSLNALPGTSWSSSGSSWLSYSLLGGPGGEAVHVFTCESK